jgi:RND family efflux transporter MFP subunit
MKLKMNAGAIKKTAIVGACLIIAYSVIHYFDEEKSLSIPLPKVAVQKPISKEVVQYVTQTGTMVAYNSVNLMARVEGYLNAILFTDGRFVKKGKPLFVIEPEPYKEKLKGAEATVIAEKAGYAYAKSEYARQKRMYKEHATSLNNVESWLARMEQSQAEVHKAVANKEIAAINYSYTHIAAPFDGRIGRHLVDIGNLVGNGTATNLATIEQVNPIYVYFNLNELDLIKLRTAARAHGFKPSDINKIPAFVKLQNETEFKHRGHLDFINTGLNASTGTLEFRAVLNNKNFDLLPGLFVKVRIPTSKPKKKLTISDAAILYDQSGAYVLTVDKNNMVHQKRVETGPADQGRRPITKGLLADDRVILQGLQFATPGKKVDPHDL